MDDFVQWGINFLAAVDNPAHCIHQIIQKAYHKNGWFEPVFVKEQLRHVGSWLVRDELKKIFPPEPVSRQKNILVIGAGNIPMAAMHDVLCVLASGHRVLLKLSASDDVLIPYLLEELYIVNPIWKSKILMVNGPLNEIRPDAVMASGSDISERIFTEYFGHLPHIFRKSRTSVGILTGSETKDEIYNLGKDIFLYFGLGCRNVTTLFIPAGYSIRSLACTWEDKFAPLLLQNKKYANNYDYYKAMFILSKIHFSDHGFFLTTHSAEKPFTPPAVVNIIEYTEHAEVEKYLGGWKEYIQVVVGKNYMLQFGFAQFPVINEFSDGTNTIEFLVNL